MKRSALFLSFLLSTSMAASAADLEYTPTAYDWSGFYLGAHIGGAWGDKNWDRIQGAGGGGGGPQDNVSDYDVDGIIGGGQFGYNIQSGSMVYGLEAEFSGAGVDGSDRPTANYFETDVNFLGSVTGRVGFAADRFLIFAEGGLAFIDEDHEHNSNAAGIINGDQTRFGWLIGGGVEWAMTDTFSAEIEYNYMDFAEDRVTLTDGGGASAIFDVDQQMHTVKFGVNMKF